MRAKREEEERKRLEEALRARQEEEQKRLEEEELARQKQVRDQTNANPNFLSVISLASFPLSKSVCLIVASTYTSPFVIMRMILTVVNFRRKH